MKNNYKRKNPLIPYFIICSVFLQSCGRFSSHPVAGSCKVKEKINALSTTQGEGLGSLINQEFTVEKGYLVTLYEQEGELQASVKTDASQEEPNYTNLPVLLAKGVNLSELVRLQKCMQQRCIQLERSPTGSPSRVVVIRGGLKGGMKRKRGQREGNASCIKAKKHEPTIVQIGLPELPAEMWESILLYLSIDDIEHAIYTCKLFKDLIFINLKNRWVLKGIIDFKGLKKESISRFQWNHLIRKVNNLPQEFWPYVAKTQIHTLGLPFNHIGDTGVSDLVSVLPSTQIQKLYLSANNIGDEGASHLAAVLPTMQIQELGLASNNIGNEGASKLVNALPNDRQLHRLVLSYNQIGGEGFPKLVEALRTSQPRELDLSNNKINGIAFLELLKALFDNTQSPKQIRTLNLSCNQIADKEALELVHVLSNHGQLYKLNLSYNNISADTEKLLKQRFLEIDFDFGSLLLKCRLKTS